jgi:stage III sporulation protein AH
MLQKRNIVLGALILALGAAVYINWNYTAADNILSVGGNPSSGTAQLGDVLYVNGKPTENPSSGPADAPSEPAESTPPGSAAAKSYFSEAVLSRQRARDQATELLKDILKAADQSEAAKKEAVAQAAKLAEAIAQESKIESLLKAKGYESCLAMLENGKASIVVGTDGLLAHETITIKDIVHNQSGLSFADIIVVEVK